MSLSGILRPIGAQLTIDESNAVSLSQEPDIAKQRQGFWLTGIAVYIFWNLLTAVGALLGSAIGNPADWGLDAAAGAAFLGLIWPRLKESKLLVLAVVSAFAATLLSSFVPAGIPVLLTAGVAVIFWIIELLGKSK
jgi:predicted branched-subunit amino acid permease